MEKALADRRSATQRYARGCASLRRAEEKTKEYEEKLRHARSAIFHEQESLRAQWRSEQTAVAVGDMKAKVDAQIQESRDRIASAQATAKASLAVESEALAEQIARTLLAGRAN